VAGIKCQACPFRGVRHARSDDVRGGA
jgi:hypothetical protein